MSKRVEMAKPRVPVDVRKFVNDLARGVLPMRQCSPYGHLQEDTGAIADYGKRLQALLNRLEHG